MNFPVLSETGGSWFFHVSPQTGEETQKGRISKMKKRVLALLLALCMVFALAACSGGDTETTDAPETDATATPAADGETEGETEGDAEGAVASGVEDGVLTVGMECAYAPYNWTQADDSNGAVPIANNPGSYANGYDVMIAKKICEENGWELEVMAIEWGGLTPALDSGTIDVAIAGQSMTADRMAEVDMAGPYYYATIVCVTTADSEYASATGIADLAGGVCTAQSGTIWYDSCLPQIENADIQAPADTAPAMIMALESGTVDFICTDMPTAMGAVAKNSNLKILDFSGTEGDFQFATEEERAENVNIGMSVVKGNTVLLDAMNAVLETMTEDDFAALMDEAIAIQPEV
jgi:ABC-type amino acid transport substrate-binding protein